MMGAAPLPKALRKVRVLDFSADHSPQRLVNDLK